MQGTGGASQGKWARRLETNDADTSSVINQKGSGDVQDLQVSGTSVFKVKNDGSVELGPQVISVGDATISGGGAIAVTKAWHEVIPNGGVGSANDDLTTATGGTKGQKLILSAKTTVGGGNNQITVKNGTGADTFILAGGADFVMDHIDDSIEFVHNGTEWKERTRSSNS